MEKKDLVIKFLNKECTAEEAKEALQFIDENPGILDELVPKSEWDDDHITPIPAHVENEIRINVDAARRKVNVIVMLKRVAVAAAAVVFIISAFLLMQPAQQKDTALAVNESVKLREFDTVVNKSNDIQQVLLPDGSRIKLHARSSVIYSTGFKNNRNIYLSGKAIFYVAKDPNAPFTVYSGAITTTALGTTFLVDAGMAATNISVQLYEGKVVVKAVDKQLAIADTYLQQGEQCNVNIALALVKVSKIPGLQSGNNDGGILAATGKKNNTDNLALDFTKVPLAQTFERLQRIFNKEIVFDGNADSLNLFTGHFDNGDSLQLILQIIAAMNGLQVEQTGNTFRLSHRAPSTIATPVNSSNEVAPAATAASVPAPIHLPAAVVSAAIDSNLNAVRADSSGMHIVDVPAGKDYRKIPLSMVFDQIAKTNNINIKYQQEQLQGLYFTGTIPNDNSSVEMLPIICRMNGLKLIKKKEGEYTVRPARQ